MSHAGENWTGPKLFSCVPTGKFLRALVRSYVFPTTARTGVPSAWQDQPHREDPRQAGRARVDLHRIRGEQPNAKDLPERENIGTVLASFKKVLLENLHLREMLVDMSSGKLPAKTLEGISQELDKFLVPARENLAKILSCRDTAAVRTDLCSTDIRADLLERWAQVIWDSDRRSSSDPGHQNTCC